MTATSYLRTDAPGAGPPVSTSSPPPVTGRGLNMLKRMGWSLGEGLGKKGGGRLLPVAVEFKNDKRGLGCGQSFDVQSFDTESSVILHSLQAQPELNGLSGRVFGFDEESRRQSVTLQSGEQVAVRSANIADQCLQSEPDRLLDVGSLVSLRNLHARLELNGFDGRVISFNEASKRCVVRLARGDQVAIRPANLSSQSESSCSEARRDNMPPASPCDEHDLRVDFEIELQRRSGGRPYEAELGAQHYFTFPPLAPHEMLIRHSQRHERRTARSLGATPAVDKKKTKARRAALLKTQLKALKAELIRRALWENPSSGLAW